MTRNVRSSPADRPFPNAPVASALAHQVPNHVAITSRHYIQLCMPQCLIGELNTFLESVFADDDLVRAYVQPVNSLETPVRLMVHQSMADANSTRCHQGFLHPYEREVAIVAAFVYRCGYYLCASQHILQPCPSCAATSGSHLECIRTARRQLLEEPLRQLRRSTPALGQTLGQVLGMDGGDNCDRHQVARIQAAMCCGLMDQR